MPRISMAIALCLCSLAGTGHVHPPTAPSPLTPEQAAAVQAMIDSSIAQAIHPPASTPAPPADFIVGVWYQPASSFAKWKARGVNTLVGYENEGGAVSLDQYKHAAAVAGLRLILQADVCREVDYADPAVVAIMALPDEPDGVGGVAPAEMVSRARAVHLQTSKPIMLNLDGWKMQYRPAADYAAYAAAAEWLSMDFYPVNRGTPEQIARIGDRLDDLGRAAPGKRRLACIECSDQNLRVQDWARDSTWGPAPALTMRGPTAAEFAVEVKTAVAHGASGVIYFPDLIGRNFEGFDGTPADVAAAMAAVPNK